MKSLRIFCCFILLAIFSPFFLSNSWAGIGVTSVSPPIIPTAQDIPVTVSANIPDVKHIPASVNLLRVDSAGKTTSIWTLNDQGLNGDAVAGDQIYSTTVHFNENAATTIQLRISAALKGTLKRIIRNFQVPVVGIPTIQDYTQYNQAIDDIFSKLVDTRNNFLAAKDTNVTPTEFFEYLPATRDNLISVYADLYAIYRFETHSPSNYPKAAEYTPILGSLIGKANEVIDEQNAFIENGTDTTGQIVAYCSEFLEPGEMIGTAGKENRKLCMSMYTNDNPNSNYF